MKKLMISMLVLSLASLANAQIQLSVNGVSDGPDNTTEITVPVSTELVIDVHGPAGVNWLGYIIIQADPQTAAGEWGDDANQSGWWGVINPPGAPPGPGFYTQAGYPVIYPAAGDMASVLRFTEWFPYGTNDPTDLWGFGYEVCAAQAVGFPLGGREFDLMFHCRAPGDAVITLWDAMGDFITPQDTIIVHQVPEPMTITLLGLGGMVLLRKRR